LVPDVIICAVQTKISGWQTKTIISTKIQFRPKMNFGRYSYSSGLLFWSNLEFRPRQAKISGWSPPSLLIKKFKHYEFSRTVRDVKICNEFTFRETQMVIPNAKKTKIALVQRPQKCEKYKPILGMKGITFDLRNLPEAEKAATGNNSWSVL